MEGLPDLADLPDLVIPDVDKTALSTRWNQCLSRPGAHTRHVMDWWMGGGTYHPIHDITAALLEITCATASNPVLKAGAWLCDRWGFQTLSKSLLFSPKGKKLSIVRVGQWGWQSIGYGWGTLCSVRNMHQVKLASMYMILRQCLWNVDNFCGNAPVAIKLISLSLSFHCHCHCHVCEGCVNHCEP